MDNLVQFVLAIGTLSALVAAGANALKLRQQAADDAATNALARMNEVVNRVEARNEALSARVTQLESQLETMRGQLLQRDEQIAVLRSEMRVLQAANVDLQRQLEKQECQKERA